MRRLLLGLGLLLLSGCPRGMVLQVDIVHRVRCTLVKQVGMVDVKVEQGVSLDECLVMLEKILADWGRPP